MILIKSVELIQTMSDYHEIRSVHMHAAHHCMKYDTSKGDSPVDIAMTGEEIQKEMVQGRHYHTADGRHIVIGMSAAVQETLGIPLSEFDQYQEEVKKFRRYLKKRTLRNRIMNLIEVFIHKMGNPLGQVQESPWI